jgi:capsular polysaccharide biosynthesis protein
VRDWFEAEEPIERGMVSELQRIQQRMRIRPLPVLVLALVITAGVAYKFMSKPRMYTSNVVLALNEGVLAGDRDNSIPFDQLKEYVAHVLLPDQDVLEVIERRAPGRVAKVGAPFAIASFWDRIEILIWKNSFAYFADEDANAQKSARIGIEVTDADPDNALEIARDMAAIAISTHDANRRKLSAELAGQVAQMRQTMNERLEELGAQLASKQQQLEEAQRTGNYRLTGTMLVAVTTINQEIKRAASQLKAIDASPDAFADRVVEAKLDTTISIVDQFKPEKVEQSGMVLAMIIMVIGTGALVGSAMVLGAFDSRVHDIDDVSRLGLPVLGHLPRFGGDHVGSLDARGAGRVLRPTTIAVAGILWMVYGGLSTLGNVAALASAGSAPGAIVGLVISGTFLRAGIRTFTGRSNVPRAWASVSLLLGVLMIATLASGALPLSTLELAVALGVASVLLVAPGVLVFIGHARYRAWQAYRFRWLAA